jgi:hypothetical protein
MRLFTNRQEGQLRKEFDKQMNVGAANIILADAFKDNDTGTLEWYDVRAYTPLKENERFELSVGRHKQDKRRGLIIL